MQFKYCCVLLGLFYIYLLSLQFCMKICYLKLEGITQN